MAGKRVLIVSTHRLFSEGLKKILAETADLAFARHANSLEEAEELVHAEQIDVIIVDRADETDMPAAHNEIFARLVSSPGIRVLTVSLTKGDLWIYRQERVIEASVEDLVAALGD
jgi:DNA-binding NarL/FixJ family response regulator